MRVRRIWSRPRRIHVLVGATVVTVLVAGLVVADRVVATRATARLTARLACVVATPSAPRVRISGFPFVRQALAGRLDRVEVDADRLSRGAVTVDRVSAVLTGTQLPDDGTRGPVRIDAAEIGFDVPFDSLPSQLRGRPVSYRSAPGGLLAVSTEVTTKLGPLPATLLARPTLSEDRLTMVPVEVDVLGIRRPAGWLTDRLGDDADLSRDLPDLPDGLGYRSVAATSTGLRITVTGRSLAVELGGDARGNGRCRAGAPVQPSSSHSSATASMPSLPSPSASWLVAP